ncbi:MAG TPA: permease-like cell division protein FtsX [Polyangiaceae bacterium]|nr:permease-like cell division protein FtsX [Polyangiaceae bacterium]
MAQSPIKRAFRGAKNDWRLHALSVFSVAVAFVCLAAALLLVVNVGQIRARWAESGRASVYLRKNATADQVAAIERALKQSEGVTAVRVVSSEDARRELIGLTNDPVLDALPTEAFPASLEVAIESAVATERLSKLQAQLSALPAVESVETYGAWSDRLAALLTGGVSASLLLAGVVLAAVVSVVSSTIRMSLQRRRIEVEVMKLVGATDSYVRSPFVVEGAAQGGFGALFAILLLGVLFGIVQSHFDSNLSALLGATPVFLPWTVTLGLVASGALLGAIAAYGSLRKLLVL